MLDDGEMQDLLVLGWEFGEEVEVGFLIVEEFIEADAGFEQCVGEDIGEGIVLGVVIGRGGEVKEQGFAAGLFGAFVFFLEDEVGGDAKEPSHRAAIVIKAFGAVEGVFGDGMEEVLCFVSDLRALCESSTVDVDAQGLEDLVEVVLDKARKQGSFFGCIERRRRPRRRACLFFCAMAFQGAVLVRCPHLAFALGVFCAVVFHPVEGVCRTG